MDWGSLQIEETRWFPYAMVSLARLRDDAFVMAWANDLGQWFVTTWQLSPYYPVDVQSTYLALPAAFRGAIAAAPLDGQLTHAAFAHSPDAESPSLTGLTVWANLTFSMDATEAIAADVVSSVVHVTEDLFVTGEANFSVNNNPGHVGARHWQVGPGGPSWLMQATDPAYGDYDWWMPLVAIPSIEGATSVTTWRTYNESIFPPGPPPPSGTVARTWGGPTNAGMLGIEGPHGATTGLYPCRVDASATLADFVTYSIGTQASKVHMYHLPGE